MTLVDSNVWIALAHPKHDFYLAAAKWLTGLSAQEALFCRATELSFLRLLTTESIARRYGVAAACNKEAWTLYEGIRADSRVGWADEPNGVDPLWRKFASHPAPSPKLWMDAYLAAFAVAGGYGLVTIDSGFRQFKELNVQVLSA